MILRRSAKYFGVLGAADLIIALPASFIYGIGSAIGLFSDITFVETALLLMIGGFYDWSQSEWSVGFRRLTGNSEAMYSRELHYEAERKGISVILAGCWFFSLGASIVFVGL